MITTSEVAVSITIDATTHLEEICVDLQKYGSVEVDKSQSIICVVGDFIQNDKGVALKVLEALKDVPIRMISYGGSEHNVSLLVNTRSEEHTSELQSRGHLVCRLLLETISLSPHSTLFPYTTLFRS